jgi:glycosyltransferase involved in cell wall biosynthesis
LKRYELQPQNLTVIPNGVDVDVFKPPEPLASEAPYLLFVGQLEKFKGLDYLFAAMPAIRSRFNSVKLLLAYHNNAELPRYQRLAKQLGIDDAVIFAGPKTPAELAALYAGAAVFVQPSLAEALSGVVLEAMSCGAAIVATEVGGIREQLDSETGIIVPPADPGAIAESVCRLLADPGLRCRLGVAARVKVERRFSISSMISSHLQLYETVLEAAPAPWSLRRMVLASVAKVYL